MKYKYGVSYTFYKYGFRCLRRLAFLNSWISILVSIEQLAARNVVMPCRQSFASSSCVAPSVVIHIQMKYGVAYTFYKYGFRCLRRLAFLNSWISIGFHRTTCLDKRRAYKRCFQRLALSPPPISHWSSNHSTHELILI